jgi:hypothetical protein
MAARDLFGGQKIGRHLADPQLADPKLTDAGELPAVRPAVK